MKILIVAVVCLLLGGYGGSWAMQKQIADKFSQGEGRTICEAILRSE
jgi:hypothetical protein